MPLPALLAALAPAAIGLVGNLMAGKASERGKQQDIAYQKEFAKHGVRWRVADAQAAGIHPAVAMGASIPSYSPVGIGSGTAEALSASSQDIGRAVAATATLDERADAFTKTTQQLSLQRMGLENELLAAQIGQINNDHGTVFPPAGGYNMDGQPGSGTIRNPGVGGTMKVAQPGLSQKAEDDFGDIIGGIYGLGNWLESAFGSVPGSSKWASEHYRDNPVRRGPSN